MKLHGSKTYIICILAIIHLMISHFVYCSSGITMLFIALVYAFLVGMAFRHAFSSSILRVENVSKEYGAKNITHEIKVEHKHDRSASRFL